jgi:hypothetical protein
LLVLATQAGFSEETLLRLNGLYAGWKIVTAGLRGAYIVDSGSGQTLLFRESRIRCADATQTYYHRQNSEKC